MYLPLFIPLVLFSILATATVPRQVRAASTLKKREVSQDVYDQLVRYVNWSKVAHPQGQECQTPLGGMLVYQINNITGMRGTIARVDPQKEFVLSLYADEKPLDFIKNLDVRRVAFRPPSPDAFLRLAGRASVHARIFRIFLEFVPFVLDFFNGESNGNYSEYSITTAGHSVGGSLASMAAVTIKANFPNTTVNTYTYGQPRTGNGDYADLVENTIGKRGLFRVVHSQDVVSLLPLQAFGYAHHGTEYWQRDEAALPSSVIECEERNDPSCSEANSVVSNLLDLAEGVLDQLHRTFFGLVFGEDDSNVCQVNAASSVVVEMGKSWLFHVFALVLINVFIFPCF